MTQQLSLPAACDGGTACGTPSGEAPADRRPVGYRNLPDSHAAGVLDFLWGVEKYNASAHALAANERADAILADAGLDPAAPVSVEHAIDLFALDPIIATRNKAYLDSQRLKMRLVSATLARHRDAYLDDLDRAAHQGPGSLALDDAFVVPAYASHELHMQPGGYVGDDLAGYVYRYALVGLYGGHNFENETHRGIAQAVPTPTDGRVVRVLDLGCGIGQLIVALKARFPHVEAWGIDTSAPMLRYAHFHATETDAEVHFAQQSAEALRFPDDHFDIVTASGLFHEIPASATRSIVAGVARVLRPGGVFFPLDLYTAGTMRPKEDARSRFEAWVSARWYHEDWREGYGRMDLAQVLREAGLQAGVNEGDGVYSSNLMAVKG